MIFSEKPAVTAGTFTKNLVKAAPVLWDKKVTDAGVAQAVVVNTGIANACTGQAGYVNAAETAKLAGEALNISSDTVLVASTGVIGFTLPMDVIADGVKKLSGMLKVMYSPHRMPQRQSLQPIRIRNRLPMRQQSVERQSHLEQCAKVPV